MNEPKIDKAEILADAKKHHIRLPGGERIDTRRSGPNMPKYQPCPKGHGFKRIEDKAVVGSVPGALYYCNQCKDNFFVRAK